MHTPHPSSSSPLNAIKLIANYACSIRANANFSLKIIALSDSAALLTACAGVGTSVGINLPIGGMGGVGVSIGSGGTVSGSVGVGVGGGSVSVGASGQLPKKADKPEEEKKP